MKPGVKSTEFWLVAGVVGFAVLVASGRLDPDDIKQAATNVNRATEALPALIEAVKSLAERFGGLAISGGLAWAYLKRKSAQKYKELKAAKNE